MKTTTKHGTFLAAAALGAAILLGQALPSQAQAAASPQAQATAPAAAPAGWHGGNWHGGGHGSMGGGMMNGGMMHGGGMVMANIPPEKQAVAQKLYAEFTSSTAGVRQQLYAKQSELNALYHGGAPDTKKYQALTREIGDLNAKIYEAQANLRAQLAKEGIPASAMGGHHMGGAGMGMMGGGHMAGAGMGCM